MARWTLQSILGLLVITCLLSLTGCETEEDRKVAAGQACLDEAKNATKANECIAIVDGLDSEKANRIRCSAYFVAQGFTTSRFASAFQQLKDNNSSGTDAMSVAMSLFVFSSTSAADTADVACQKSGSRGLQRLSTMAKLATTVASFAGGIGTTTWDPSNPSLTANMTAAIQTLVSSGSPAAKEQIGTIAITANSQYCNEGSSFKDTEICRNLSTAVSSGASAQTIGTQLLTALQQQTAH